MTHEWMTGWEDDVMIRDPSHINLADALKLYNHWLAMQKKKKSPLLKFVQALDTDKRESLGAKKVKKSRKPPVWMNVSTDDDMDSDEESDKKQGKGRRTGKGKDRSKEKGKSKGKARERKRKRSEVSDEEGTDEDTDDNIGPSKGKSTRKYIVEEKMGNVEDMDQDSSSDGSDDEEDSAGDEVPIKTKSGQDAGRIEHKDNKDRAVTKGVHGDTTKMLSYDV